MLERNEMSTLSVPASSFFSRIDWSCTTAPTVHPNGRKQTSMWATARVYAREWIFLGGRATAALQCGLGRQFEQSHTALPKANKIGGALYSTQHFVELCKSVFLFLQGGLWIHLSFHHFEMIIELVSQIITLFIHRSTKPAFSTLYILLGWLLLGFLWLRCQFQFTY